MSILILLNWAFVAYIVVESYISFWHMNKCDDPLKVVRYFLANVTSMTALVIYYLQDVIGFKACEDLLALWILPDLAISAQFVKVTYFRAVKSLETT